MLITAVVTLSTLQRVSEYMRETNNGQEFNNDCCMQARTLRDWYPPHLSHALRPCLAHRRRPGQQAVWAQSPDTAATEPQTQYNKSTLTRMPKVIWQGQFAPGPDKTNFLHGYTMMLRLLTQPHCTLLLQGDVQKHAASLGLETGGLKPELIDRVLRSYQEVNNALPDFQHCWVACIIACMWVDMQSKRCALVCVMPCCVSVFQDCVQGLSPPLDLPMHFHNGCIASHLTWQQD